MLDRTRISYDVSTTTKAKIEGLAAAAQIPGWAALDALVSVATLTPNAAHHIAKVSRDRGESAHAVVEDIIHVHATMMIDMGPTRINGF